MPSEFLQFGLPSFLQLFGYLGFEKRKQDYGNFIPEICHNSGCHEKNLLSSGPNRKSIGACKQLEGRKKYFRKKILIF